MEKLVTRKIVDDEFSSTAVFSDCFSFRYSITRTWDHLGSNLLYILLNPSTATEKKTDPTLTRCQRRALNLGYKQFRVCNLFAFRASNPALLNSTSNIVGVHNDEILAQSITWADDIICSWGNLGTIDERNLTVQSFLQKSGKPIYHLGLTKKHQPKHLLYISFDIHPKKWF
ncbi:MAG: DUF1643 domain-containing protein [Pseudomonadota bacterium]|nr:DUF1643 domain-containing protein [Pseudomonadota bacterium]